MKTKIILQPSGEEIEFIFIDLEDNGYVSMPKSVYDEQQKAVNAKSN